MTNPRTPNSIYTTHIAMSSGLIENGERFHVCIQDLETDKTMCYSLTNGYENEPEEITIRV